MSGQHETDTTAAIAALTDILSLLATLKVRKVRLSVASDERHIHFDAPKGAFSPDLVERVRKHKPALLAALIEYGSDAQGVRYGFERTYHALLREALSVWGKTHKYPQLTYERWGAGNGGVPRQWIPSGARSWTWFIARKDDAAIEAAYRAIESEPDESEGER